MNLKVGCYLTFSLSAFKSYMSSCMFLKEKLFGFNFINQLTEIFKLRVTTLIKS